MILSDGLTRRHRDRRLNCRWRGEQVRKAVRSGCRADCEATVADDRVSLGRAEDILDWSSVHPLNIVERDISVNPKTIGVSL